MSLRPADGLEGISVVLPAYNEADYIHAAIQSILDQSYPHFELILVDDGSTDATGDIARDYALRDERIRFLRTDHRNVSCALNRGIAASRHPWVAIMHADDVALPHRLERQMQAARAAPEVVAWGSYAYHIHTESHVLGVSAFGPTTLDEFRDLRRRGAVVGLIHSSALLRKDAVERAGGYDPRFHTCEDFDLLDRMADVGPVLVLPEPLIQRRLHMRSNTMRTFFAMKRLTRYVRVRRRARTADTRPPTLDEFLDAYRRRSLFSKARTYLDDLSQLYYRKAAIHRGKERYAQAVGCFLISTVLNPAYALPRFWEQQFSHRAQRQLDDAGAWEGVEEESEETRVKMC